MMANACAAAVTNCMQLLLTNTDGYAKWTQLHNCQYIGNYNKILTSKRFYAKLKK